MVGNDELFPQTSEAGLEAAGGSLRTRDSSAEAEVKRNLFHVFTSFQLAHLVSSKPTHHTNILMPLPIYTRKR